MLKRFKLYIQGIKEDRRAYGKRCAQDWYERGTYTLEQLAIFGDNVIDHDEFDRGIQDFVREIKT